MDVFVKDDNNTVYDIEMQTTKQPDLGKRSRYYQGMIDLHLIERGAKFRELKKSYIIFICMTDPYSEGRHIYTFENICQESPGLRMGDDAVKVFLNTSGNMDDVPQNLIEFFNLLNTGQGSTDLCNRIEKEVIRAREHKEWRSEYMTLYMRDQENLEKGRAEGRVEGLAEGRVEGLAEGRVEGRENQLRESISRMIITKRFSNSEIADLLGTSLEMVASVEKDMVITED